MGGRITILMPVLNGARHLPAQLDSLAAQTELPRRLIVSDDGSSDDSLAILRRYADVLPFDVEVRQGPRAGYAANTLALIRAAPGGPLALADQDDVWLPGKLGRARGLLQDMPGPAMVTGPRIVTDAGLRRIGVTGRLKRRPCFANALVQNVAPGNTIILNSAAARLAQASAATLGNHRLPFADWWLTQLILGAGGQVLADTTPQILYRQHGDNMLGSALGRGGRLQRLRLMFDGTYGAWIRAQAEALAGSQRLLFPACRDHLAAFLDHADRPQKWWQRGTLPLGMPARQSCAETALLRLAILTGRF